MFKILFISLITSINANPRCSTATSVPKYHLIEPCHRSTLGIAARAKYSSLTSCKRLGIEKKALALNFSPTWNRSEPEYPCEVLKCSEAEGGLSLNNDTRYDYYSIYLTAKPIPNVNATCVPSIGMFYLLSRKLNYTNADDKCKNMSSTLADVNSEQRTDALAQFLTGAGVATAFVGLKKDHETRFIEVNGNGLDCTTYRAWAPGHPRRNRYHNCILLTKQHTWRTTSCENKQQALCELIPHGPYKKGSIFKDSP
ncbi:LOW QUALITY PROTEIN: uncharacterized protein LOC125050783 [Pieris napi]|uniref:LOW QUALITY PROTEIN: uncharacterized protein LOC125050783 n=1 Tax=Pieris napi TaxID=78633 RepID=UPI001FBAEE56|nr:LOW QUALITY PROTEIN: uncharacterized protein LOC125050783 [Pieris napi]